MKRPTMLYQAMLNQISIDLKVSTERDYSSLSSRLEHEGLSFITITLPLLCDSFEEGIELGRFTLPNGFKPFRRGGTLPAFLQGLFKRVFELDGSLLDEPCPDTIYWIRQVLRFFKKPKIACTPQREAEAIRKFINVEEELNASAKQIRREDSLLDEVARILWTSVFSFTDDSGILCRHGPGVTADRRLSNERRRIRYWYQRFESSFPCADHAFPNYGLAWSGGSSEGINGIEYLDVNQEPPVRVVFVPKTLKAPRVIAIEPSSMQFVQQGFARWMMRAVEGHRLTCNSIRFTDQTVNRKLAYKASMNRRLATIDLSDASDRVHMDLVNRIFQSTQIAEYLQDARSLHATLPDGTNLILNKYASMGSALCFPVEACVFYTLILSSIISHLGKRPSYKLISELSEDISVYGDDIIIPTVYVDVVSSYLESYALRVNRRKSFSKSAFRESCGADFYNGVSVLPVYARQTAPTRREDWTPSHVMSWAATSDHFYKNGSWVVAQAIRDMVQDVVRVNIPRSRSFASGVGFFSYLFDTDLKYNRDLCSYRQKRLHYTPSKREDIIDGDLTACLNLYFERGQNRLPTERPHVPLYEWDYLDEPDGSRLERRGQILHLRPVDARSRVETDSSFEAVGGNNECEELVGFNHQLFAESFRFSNFKELVPEIDPNGIDFRNSTKRGVFTLKRRWATIIS